MSRLSVSACGQAPKIRIGWVYLKETWGRLAEEGAETLQVFLFLLLLFRLLLGSGLLLSGCRRSCGGGGAIGTVHAYAPPNGTWHNIYIEVVGASYTVSLTALALISLRKV